VLVMRQRTERPEAVEAGTVTLVGTDPRRITGEATLLLDDPAEYSRRSRIHNPYGDGHASGRIAAAIAAWGNTPGEAGLLRSLGKQHGLQGLENDVRVQT
jgi:UDP-N-acetylglucosamine 2-epimerase